MRDKDLCTLCTQKTRTHDAPLGCYWEHVFRMASTKHQHIPPHRAWTHSHAHAQTFSRSEHVHILECERCLRVFLLCLKSESFGSVLRELGEPDELRSA